MEGKLQERVQVLEQEMKHIKDNLGIPALLPPEKPSKRIIFADLVTEEGCSWMLKESGICIKFSPNAVQTPVMVTSSLWRPGTVSPPLQDDETLVSNIIELACDDPVAIQFSKVTVALSHSATELRGYELVLKERIVSEEDIWKDLETCCPLDPLDENSLSQSGLRFAQAKITSFSMYAVISRLKSYKFLVTEESPEFTCTVTEYPDVSLTVPTRCLPAVKDFTFTLKIQQTPNDDYEEKGAFVSPILHISCPEEVALEEPAFIRIPITLEEKQIDLQNLSSSQIRVFHRCTRKKTQQWEDITRKLKTPPKLENGVVSFQVKRFSKYVAVAQIADFVQNILSLIPDPPAPQHAGFLAYLCDATDPEQFLLILCCSPCHLTSEVKRDVPSTYRVILHGESTSNSPLNKEDRASFHLPDTFTLINQAYTYLTFLGDQTCRKQFPVLVKSTKGIQSINFFKFNNGCEETEPLCTVPIVIKSALQGYPGIPASKPLASEGEPLDIAKYSKLWKTSATLKPLLPLMEDLGNCWKDLGVLLGLSSAQIANIEEDRNSNKERASAVLSKWIEKEGTAATMGRLADCLRKIEKNSIVHKLIAGAQHCDKKDEENEISKHSELKDEQDPVEEQEKQAEELEILENKITKLEDEVKNLNSDLTKEKEIVEELQQRVEELQKREQKLQQQVEESQILEEDLKEKEADILSLSSDLKSERQNAKELEQKLQQRLKESKILKKERSDLQDQNKQKEVTVTKLTSDLKNEQNRAKELEQRVAESELNDEEFKRIQEVVKKKDKEIEELKSKFQTEQKQKEKQAQESEIFVDECNKLHEELKKKDDRISKLTSDLKNTQTRAQQLEQQAEESGMLEDENKRVKDEEIKALKSELEHAKKEEQKRGEETGVFVEECDKLRDEVKEKEETITKLTSELEDERKRVQKLEQQIHEAKIVEEELKRLAPA